LLLSLLLSLYCLFAAGVRGRGQGCLLRSFSERDTWIVFNLTPTGESMGWWTRHGGEGIASCEGHERVCRVPRRRTFSRHRAKKEKTGDWIWDRPF
jgi:hypothetical protein